MLYIGLILGVFALDMILKNKIDTLPDSELPKEISGGRITICRSHNSGMMMNLLDHKPELVKKVTAGVGILTLLWYIPQLFRSKGRLIKLGGALLLGGGASNIADHFRRGYVVDYIKFKWKPIHRIAFNLADLFIFLGCTLTLLGSLFQKD